MLFLMCFVKNLTTKPVLIAEIIVPSRVPIILQSKNINESITDSKTQAISNATFTLPNSKPNLSAIALTIA